MHMLDVSMYIANTTGKEVDRLTAQVHISY